MANKKDPDQIIIDMGNKRLLDVLKDRERARSKLEERLAQVTNNSEFPSVIINPDTYLIENEYQGTPNFVLEDNKGWTII